MVTAVKILYHKIIPSASCFYNENYVFLSKNHVKTIAEIITINKQKATVRKQKIFFTPYFVVASYIKSSGREKTLLP